MKVIKELVAKEGVYPANSINPTRIEGHQATVFLIAQSFSWKLPDWIAVPIGNGSNCSSIGKALRLLKKMGLEVKTRILGCQSVAAYPLTASWRSGISQKQWEKEYRPTHVTETTATAARIGNPASYKKVIREIIASNGAMMISREQDLNTAVAICGKDGINVCPQTGIALTGVMNAVESGLIKKGETVVVVSTATGLKFADSATANLQKNIIQASDCKTSTVAKIMGL